MPFFNKGKIIGVENHPLKHDVPKPHSREEREKKVQFVNC
jgi:hypothetical protein